MAQGKGGELFRIIFTANNLLQHCPSTLPEGVCCNARQLDVGVFQHLLNTATNTRSFLGQTCSHSCQVAQIADDFAGYIARPQKTML